MRPRRALAAVFLALGSLLAVAPSPARACLAVQFTPAFSPANPPDLVVLGRVVERLAIGRYAVELELAIRGEVDPIFVLAETDACAPLRLKPGERVLVALDANEWDPAELGDYLRAVWLLDSEGHVLRGRQGPPTWLSPDGDEFTTLQEILVGMFGLSPDTRMSASEGLPLSLAGVALLVLGIGLAAHAQRAASGSRQPRVTTHRTRVW
jgi:hypothetical protein